MAARVEQKRLAVLREKEEKAKAAATKEQTRLDNIAKQQAKAVAAELKKKQQAAKQQAKAVAAELKKQQQVAKILKDEMLPSLVSVLHGTKKLTNVVLRFKLLHPAVSKSQVELHARRMATRGAIDGVKGQRWIVHEEHLKTFKMTKEDLAGVEIPTIPEATKNEQVLASQASSSNGSSTAASATNTTDTPAESSTTTTAATAVDTTATITTTTTAEAASAPAKKNVDLLSTYLCMTLTSEQRVKFQYLAFAKEIQMLAETNKRKAETTSSTGRGKRAKISLPMGWTAITTVRTSGKCAGSKDTTYISPDGKTKCRSMLEVERFLVKQNGAASSSPSSSSASSAPASAASLPSVSDMLKKNPHLTPPSKRKRAVAEDEKNSNVDNKEAPPAARVKKVAKKAILGDTNANKSK